MLRSFLLTCPRILALGLLLAGGRFLTLTSALIATGRCRLALPLGSTRTFFLPAAGTTLLALVRAQFVKDFRNFSLRIVGHAFHLRLKEGTQVIEAGATAAKEAVQLVAPFVGGVRKILADVFAFFRSYEQAYAHTEKQAIEETSHGDVLRF